MVLYNSQHKAGNNFHDDDDDDDDDNKRRISHNKHHKHHHHSKHRHNSKDTTSSYPIGPTAVTGPQGPVGAIGPQGLVGATGPQGLVGLTGPQGPVGVSGPQGLVGPTGPQGLVGLTGPQGPVGASGPQGLVGATGPQGLVGATGPQGLVGPTGPQGPAGPRGPAGSADNLDVDSGVIEIKNIIEQIIELFPTSVINISLENGITAAGYPNSLILSGDTGGIFVLTDSTGNITSRINICKIAFITLTDEDSFVNSDGTLKIAFLPAPSQLSTGISADSEVAVRNVMESLMGEEGMVNVIAGGTDIGMVTVYAVAYGVTLLDNNIIVSNTRVEDIK